MSLLSVQLEPLINFSVVFNQMSLKDLVLFISVAKREGMSHDQLMTETGYDKKSIQGAMRKLTGSHLAANTCRYKLVKEAVTASGSGYFLTTRGKEFIKLLG